MKRPGNVQFDWIRLRRRLLNVLLVIALAVLVSIPAAYHYWQSSDWWAYVIRDGHKEPKFELPGWFQICASMLVGFVRTALVALPLIVIVVLVRRYRKHRSP